MLSHELELSLIAAVREAKRRRHEYVTLEHVFFALLYDDKVARLLEECGGDINELKEQVEQIMNDLVAKRGIYDYLVVCDNTNNTNTRIDRNELYVDVAIEPVKAAEFIFIPIRLKNTGEIGAGNVASSSAV